MENNDPRLIELAEADNVLILATRLEAGEAIQVRGIEVTTVDGLSLGHKIASRNIAAGDSILKYNFPIGVATTDIALGEHVHVHNVRSDYTPTYIIPQAD